MIEKFKKFGNYYIPNDNGCLQIFGRRGHHLKNVEYITSLLNSLGPQYKILDMNNCVCSYNQEEECIEYGYPLNHKRCTTHVGYETNLPWEVYCETTNSNINPK